MYDKIGKKIKALTKVLSIILIVISVIFGIVSFCLSGENGIFLIYGFTFLIFMPIFIWIGSFTLYGFGELVDKVCDIESRLSGSNLSTPSENKGTLGKEESARKSELKKLRDQGLLSEEEYNEFLSKTE